MKLSTMDKLAIAAIAISSFIEVIGTIALAIGAIFLLHHFIVKFW